MKTESKPFASLSSGLLARKGAARPAMRPQGFTQLGSGLEDLGWNDMGFEPPKPADPGAEDGEHDGSDDSVQQHPSRTPLAGLTPVDSPVHSQQAEIAGRLSAYAPEDSGEDEEFDETAELYDPNADEIDDEDEQEIVEALQPAAEEESEETLVLDEPVVESPPEPVFTVAPIAPVSAVAEPAPVRRSRKPRAAPGSKEKAAFTLRLDPDRHLKLRLACAVNGQSAQMLVTQAVDELLATMPELDSMAEKAKRKG